MGSVSKAVIKLLLDDMLDDAILNDGEKESILEENSARADQARDLIDTVKRKGDNASRKFIEHFKNRDNSLFSKLGLSCEEQGSCDQPAPPGELTHFSQTFLLVLNSNCYYTLTLK